MMSNTWSEWAVRYAAFVGGPVDTARICQNREEAEALVAFAQSRGAEAHLVRRTVTAGEWENQP